MTTLRRLAARYALDVAVIAGVACIAYGVGQLPMPWGAVLAPIVVGVGLIATVRFGSS